MTTTNELAEALRLMGIAACLFGGLVLAAYYVAKAASKGWHHSKREYMKNLLEACNSEEDNGKKP